MQDLVKHDRAEAPDVDADVELPRLRLQSAVRVAVQIDPTLTHAAPAAKWVMTEDQGHAVDLDLNVGLDALPTLEFSRLRRVVVAGDEVLPAVEANEEICDD